MYFRSAKVSETPSSQRLLKYRGVAVVTDYVLTPSYSVARQMAVTRHERFTDKTGESRLGWKHIRKF